MENFDLGSGILTLAAWGSQSQPFFLHYSLGLPSIDCGVWELSVAQSMLVQLASPLQIVGTWHALGPEIRKQHLYRQYLSVISRDVEAANPSTASASASTNPLPRLPLPLPQTINEKNDLWPCLNKSLSRKMWWGTWDFRNAQLAFKKDLERLQDQFLRIKDSKCTLWCLKYGTRIKI